MSRLQTLSEKTSRYIRGFEWFKHLAEHQLIKKPWKRLGLFSYYDAPYIENDMLYLSPKQVITIMAKIAKKENNGLLIVVDSLEKGEMGLKTKEGFEQFLNVFEQTFPSAAKFYFGPKTSERKWLHEFPSLKIPMSWLVKRPNVFAEVLSDASPVGEQVSPADAAFEDLEGLREILIEKMGPPSLTEEVMGKIRSAEASDFAGEAVGIMTVFISPATAVSRGVKYLGKFMNLVKERRKQEIREIYQEWQEKVEKGYQVENLRKFFSDDPKYESDLVELLKQNRTVLLILETRDTLYDLFVPLILQQLVEEIGYLPPHLRPKKKPREGNEEELISRDKHSDVQGKSESNFEEKPETIIFLDAATHLSKFNKSFAFALGIPEKFPNIAVGAAFFTDVKNINDNLREAVIEYMKDRALVFDLHPRLFDLVTQNMPVTKKAWLLGRLQELERVRTDGGVGFLEYYSHEKTLWKLYVVEKPEKGLFGELKSWFRRATQ